MSRRLLLPLIAALSGCSCEEPPAPASGSASAPISASVASASASAPEPSPTLYKARTTSASIELNNLDSQIEATDLRLQKTPNDVALRGQLVGLLLLRARVLGWSADLLRARDLAEETVTLAPDTHDSYFLRARGRAATHKFVEALADLDEAEKRLAASTLSKMKEGPMIADAILGTRISVLVGQGQYDNAEGLLKERLQRVSTTLTLGDYAALLGRMGRLQEADAKFLEAEQKFRSISPTPLMDLYFDRGRMWERAGDLTLATKLYQAAMKRMSVSVHVATHLAQLIPPAEGVALLEPLTGRSDDGDLFAQLGTLKNLISPGTGDADLAKAGALYDEHYAKLPEAYADHAGWFWAGPGKDPTKAVAAAKVNLKERQTAEAYELAIAAGEAAKDAAFTCEAKKGAEALKYSSPKLKEQLQKLEGKIGCGDAGITPVPSASATPP